MWGNGLAALPFAYVVLVASWTVLVAELVGDKTITSSPHSRCVSGLASYSRRW